MLIPPKLTGGINMARIVAHSSDSFALMALTKIAKRGHDTRIIGYGEYAESNEVAIFTLDGKNRDVFKSKHVRMAVHRLLEAGVVPTWASMTPYMVAVREHPNEIVRVGLNEALRCFTEAYDMWFAGRSKTACPWGGAPTGDQGAYIKWRHRINGNSSVSGTIRSFFSHLEPHSGRCLREAARRLESSSTIGVTAFCPHFTEDRSTIVSELYAPVMQGVAKFVESLPIRELRIHTFHPDDWERFRLIGLGEMFLGSIMGNPDRLAKTWELSRSVVEQLPVKMTLHPMHALLNSQKVVEEALREAAVRGRKMIRKIQSNPPPYLTQYSPRERETRMMADAASYLLLTANYPDAIYIGFEVRSIAWTLGTLNQIGDKYLPLMFVPDCLRQHWAPWAFENGRKETLAKFMRQISY